MPEGNRHHNLREPQIYDHVLPEAEQQSVHAIRIALPQLNRFIVDFETVVSLFEFSKANPNISDRWDMLAARFGTIAIWNFHKVIISVMDQFQYCRQFSDMVDHSKIKLSGKLFRRTFFSGFDDLRQATGHAGEIFGDKDPFGKHGIKAEHKVTEGIVLNMGGEGAMIPGMALVGDKFTTSWEGRVVSYHVNGSSLEKLKRVQSLFYSAFEGAAETTSRLLEEWKREHAAQRQQD